MHNLQAARVLVTPGSFFFYLYLIKIEDNLIIFYGNKTF